MKQLLVYDNTNGTTEILLGEQEILQFSQKVFNEKENGDPEMELLFPQTPKQGIEYLEQYVPELEIDIQ